MGIFCDLAKYLGKEFVIAIFGNALTTLLEYVAIAKEKEMHEVTRACFFCFQEYLVTTGDF